MASSSSRTPTPITSARSRNTSIPSASLHVSCGATRLSHRMPSTSICGTITLSQPDSAVQAERLNALPRLPREKEGPVFAEPWEAQAFALTVKLSEQGHFTWSEWARALGDGQRADRSSGPGNPQGSLGRGVSAHAPWQARRTGPRTYFHGRKASLN